MIKFIIEIPYVSSIKDKRKVVKSLKERIRIKFKVSVAEVDLQDSLKYAQIGAAVVSNSRQFGEKIMNKILYFLEDNSPGRLMDTSIFSQQF